MFSSVIGFSYIFTFIASANIVLLPAARTIVLSRSSAMPFAAFAILLAVAGQIRIRSESFARSIWRVDTIPPENISVKTGFLLKVSNISGVMNCWADFVITTLTSTPSS